MTIQRLSTRLLLRPEDVAPSATDFEVVGVFNPGAARAGDEVVLLVRVAERPRERRHGFTVGRDGIRRRVDRRWVPERSWSDRSPCGAEEGRRAGPAHVHLPPAGGPLRGRKGGARDHGRTVSATRGVEEFASRIPYHALNGRFYFTYVWRVAARPGDGPGVHGRLPHVRAHGVISAREQGRVLFPEPIGGPTRAARPVCGTPFTRPEMWVARSPDLIHWGGHAPLVVSGGEWQSAGLGGAAADPRPVGGWLAIYTGTASQPAGEVGAYYGAAILLDAADPARVLRRRPGAFFVPEASSRWRLRVRTSCSDRGGGGRGDACSSTRAADAVTAVAEF